MRINCLQLAITMMLVGMTSKVFAVMPASGFVMPTDQAVGVIVKMRNDSTPLAIAKAGGQPRLSTQTVAEMKVVAAMDMHYKRTMTQGAHVLDFATVMSVADAQAIADRLMTMPDVEYATPNLVIKPLLTTPNDPSFVDGTQWALNGTLAGANLPLAWDTTTGSNMVPIAVIDTGYTRHSELDSTNFASDGYDFISDINEAGDSDGRDADARDEGDFCTTDGSNSSWHGTAVMSIIGALTNNNTLMAGVNWHAKLIPVRVLGRCGGTSGDLIDAIRWAAGLHVSGVPDNANPAKVINMSLGGTGTCDALMQSAIDDAHAAGAVLIAAAGNDAQPASSTVPANCIHVMAIAAHDQSGNIAYFSNYGDKVDLSAPGVAIYFATCSSTSTYSCDGSTAMATNSGTSLSAPMVSGVVSLLFSKDSTLNNYYLESILRQSARAFDTNSSCINKCGSGMLDAAAALALINNFVAPASQVEISKNSGGAVAPGFWIGLGVLAWLTRRIKQRAISATDKR